MEDNNAEENNMMNRILDKYIKVVGNNTELVNMAHRLIQNSIINSNLPFRFELKGIDISNVPFRVSSSIKDVVNNKIDSIDSCVYCFDSFLYSGYFIAKCIEDYITERLIADKHIKSLLYIDTQLLLEDYKKLFSKNNDTISPRHYYSLDVLYHQVYDADFIFWDNFSINYISTDYELTKIYEILKTRYYNCLGNLFCSNSPDNKNIVPAGNQEILNVMNCSKNLFDLRSMDDAIGRSL